MNENWKNLLTDLKTGYWKFFKQKENDKKEVLSGKKKEIMK